MQVRPGPAPFAGNSRAFADIREPGWRSGSYARDMESFARRENPPAHHANRRFVGDPDASGGEAATVKTL
jgi:hypothetical protein